MCNMTKKRRHSLRSSLAAALLGAGVLASCASPQAPPPLTAPSASTGGTLTIQVSLPRQVQALVSNTQSLRVLLRNPGLIGPDKSQTVNGSGSQTITFSALPPGSGYTLYAGGYSGLNGTGTLMSWGSLPMVLQSGLNNASLGLAVRVGAGSAADDLITGPAGNQARLGLTQWSQSAIADFMPGSASGTELFAPGLDDYMTSYGGSGTANGQFSTIEQMAFDRYGNLYVADRLNHRVQKFDRTMAFSRAWGNGTIWTSGTPAPAPLTGTANGYFDNPTGIAVDAQGNVYVADTYNARIQKFDSNGTFLMGWGNGTRWEGATAAPAPAAGSANGAFSSPGKIALDRDQNLYVADLDNYRVQKFSTRGIFLLGIGNGTTWTGAAPAPASGSAAGFFARPVADALDSQGNLYVTDLGNSRVQRFTPDGAFLSQWGTVGSADGQFPNDVHGLGIDLFGRIWVANRYTTNYLQIFSPSGQFVARITGQTANQLLDTRAITLDASGDVYIGDELSGVISKYRSARPDDPNGGIRLAGYRSPGPSNFVANGTYASPVLDAQSVVTWGSLYWNVSSLPALTGVSAAVATSSDALNWGTWQTVAATSVQGNNTASLAGASYNSRFLKYRLTLTTTNSATSSVVQEAGVLY